MKTPSEIRESISQMAATLESETVAKGSSLIASVDSLLRLAEEFGGNFAEGAKLCIESAPAIDQGLRLALIAAFE